LVGHLRRDCQLWNLEWKACNCHTNPNSKWYFRVLIDCFQQDVGILGVINEAMREATQSYHHLALTVALLLLLGAIAGSVMTALLFG